VEFELATPPIDGVTYLLAHAQPVGIEARRVTLPLATSARFTKVHRRVTGGFRTPDERRRISLPLSLLSSASPT
jgi:hypothetical protein